MQTIDVLRDQTADAARRLERSKGTVRGAGP